MAVLEMGMSHMGEINYLASIAKPDVAVITNIGMSHIENLGSQENIWKSKMQICDFFDENGLLVVNGDDEFLRRGSDKCKVISCGIENKNCDLVAEDIPADFIIVIVIPCTISNIFIIISNPSLTNTLAIANLINSFIACSGRFISVREPQVLNIPTTKNRTNKDSPIACKAPLIFNITFHIEPPLNVDGDCPIN